MLPQQISGPYTIAVRTDSGQAVLEPDTRYDNIKTAAIAIATAAADLAVDTITVPAAARTGETIDIAWTVRNVGNGATDAASWTDRIVLSTGTTIDSSSIVLGNVVHAGAVAANGSYTGHLSVAIPNSIVGTYNVFVVSDVGQQVYENGRLTNNIGKSTGTISVVSSVAPDLFVTQRYRAGDGCTRPAAEHQLDRHQHRLWRRARDLDRHGLFRASTGQSRGRRFAGQCAAFRSRLRRKLHREPDGDVAAVGGWFRDGSWSSPIRQRNLRDRAESQQHGALRPLTYQHPDLTPTALSVANADLNSGDPAVVSWTITNTGTGPALGNWNDVIYLSRDGVVGQDDIKLGTFALAGPLAAGASYTMQQSVPLPLGATGSYKLLVVSDNQNSAD